MTIKEVRGELVMEWKIKVTTKEGIVIKFPGKFHGYKLAMKEEVEGNEGLKEINFEDDYFQEIINPDFEKIDSPFQQTSSLKPYVLNVILEKIIIDLEDEVVNLLKKEKSDKKENPKVIAPGMFKLNVSQCVSPISINMIRTLHQNPSPKPSPEPNPDIATVLFDFGADFCFISSKFSNFLNMESCIVNLGYVIEIADGESREVDRVIRDYKLELGNSLFTIDLIPLGHGSFDMIVKMDWLSKNKAVIVCLEKVVDIPIKAGGILRVHEELGYYRRFIANFSKIAKTLTSLTQKNQKYEWGEKEEEAFQTMKNNMCDGPIMLLPDEIEDFVVYCDASNQGLGCVLMQRRKEKHSCKKATWLRSTDGKEGRRDSVFYGYDMVPLVGDVSTLILNEAYKSRYSVHPGVDKISRSGHDAIWVIVDRLTKSAHFQAIREDFSTKKLARLYIDVILARHGVPVSIILDRDGQFTSHFWQMVQKALGKRLNLSTAYHPQTYGQSECIIQTLKDMLRACIIDFGGSWDVRIPLAEFSYNSSYHSSIRCAPFEALNGRKCRSLVLWADIGEGSLIGPELVLETTDKVVLIKEKIKAARDHQNSYANKRHKPLEFKVGDQVLLRVSPWKGIVHFGKKGKLAPRYVGPFEILERIGLVSYKLRLPEEYNSMHDTIRVSNLKKCLANANLHVPLDEIKVDKTLCFFEEPVEIMKREIKKLKCRKLVLVKVRLNSKCGPEFTWEHEDQMRIKYPQLFVD
uniref:Putative reverse transcriptase domain-containing protein n=1 Tax=Tanacetum cinerariifolium TaxID=118510 RepID=A0A6L2KF37_TANCI|nr:putative reverse transcriptase domain-containing protein [Tanacetum cinerariifolium]